MKRGNDNSQMRREEVEALNDDDDQSDDGAERGTFKRASADVLAGRKIIKIRRSGAPAVPTNSAAPAATAAPMPAVSFGGFSGLVATGAVKEESERAKKIRKLNESFLKWASKQIETHPLSIWKEGVKDYIKHYKGIEEKYGEDGSSAPVSAATTASTAAPASEPVKAGPFSGFQFGATATAPAPAPAPVAAAKPAATASPFASFTFGAAPAAAPAAPVVVVAPLAPVPTPMFSSAAPAKPAAAAEPFKSFSFGAPVAAAPAASAAPSFLNSFSAGAPAFGAGGFAAPTTSFGGFGAAASGTTAGAAFGSVGAGAAAGGDDEGGEGGDEEGEPILEPEKVLRNENDTDDILHEVPCKLYGYSAADKEWKDTGKGTFRITRDAKTNKQRMLVRNQIGRINFNASFFQGMKVEKVQKRLKFAAFVSVEDPTIGADGKAAKPRTEMKSFMIQLKAEDLDATLKKMQNGIASV